MRTFIYSSVFYISLLSFVIFILCPSISTGILAAISGCIEYLIWTKTSEEEHYKFTRANLFKKYFNIDVREY